MLGNSRNSRGKLRKQRGVVLVLTALFFVPILIGILILIMDIGKAQIVTRQMQNFADAAALLGVNQLYKENPLSPNIDDWAQGYGWQDVKPAIKELAQLNKIKFVSKFTPSNNFDLGASTVDDMSGFDKNTMTTGGTKGVVTVTVKRYLGCFDAGASTVRTILLDNKPRTYCLANLVTVEVRVDNLSTYLAKLFGAASLNNIVRDATAHIRPLDNNSCGVPSCTGMDALVASQPCKPIP